MRLRTLICTLLLTAVVMPASAQSKAQRRPLQKKQLTFKAPTKYERRVLRYDVATGRTVYYDPMPRVQLLDAKSGRYAFKWLGYDGREKTVLFQRADAIDAVVSAAVRRLKTGQYLYTYNVTNLQSSGTNLGGLAVQSFAADLRPVSFDNIHFGHMSKNEEMKYGNWIRFALLPDFKPAVTPGRSVEFSLESAAPPGLVECRIHGGELGLKGAGEDMPQELENILPGYKDWPSGYTIGPNENLGALSTDELVHDIRLWLPQFRKLGWMSADAAAWYTRNLRPHSLAVVFQRADQDLTAGLITTETYAVIQTLRR
jgi:hypothetical protein